MYVTTAWTPARKPAPRVQTPILLTRSHHSHLSQYWVCFLTVILVVGKQFPHQQSTPSSLDITNINWTMTDPRQDNSLHLLRCSVRKIIKLINQNIFIKGCKKAQWQAVMCVECGSDILPDVLPNDDQLLQIDPIMMKLVNYITFRRAIYSFIFDMMSNLLVKNDQQIHWFMAKHQILTKVASNNQII